MPSATRPGRARRLSFAHAVIAVCSVVVLVAACGGATATPAPSLGPIDLNGTSWRLISYLSPDGTNFTVPSAVTPGATFANGQFQGDTGCNTASGPYTQNGTAISIGPIASTKKACQDPMAAIETAYLASLAVIDKAVGNDTTLLLTSSTAGFTAMKFVRAN